MLVPALLLSGALASASPACSWDRPGHNSFTGDVPSAVDRYTDIPPETRERLKQRMQAHAYEDVVEISRDTIRGSAEYAPEISGMHFGEGSVCQTVTREKWKDQHRERGLVYCEDGQCIMVPTVCRNVSRVVRTSGPPPAGPGTPDSELPFDPPGAGAPVVPIDPPAATSVPPVPPAVDGPPPLRTPLVPATPSFVPPLGGGNPPGGGVVVPPVLPPIILLPPGEPGVPIPAVPEPSTYALMLAGIAGLALWLRRRARTSAPCRS
ncbi:MAG: MHFG family PEP-CTERM protein [Burkholderiaceae bacterium]